MGLFRYLGKFEELFKQEINCDNIYTNCVLGGEPLIKFIEQSKCEIKKDKIKQKLKEMQTDFQY